MRGPSALGLLLQACALLPPPVAALVGVDTDMFEPTCAYACLRSLGSFMLSCSSHDAAGGGHSHGDSGMTPPSCRAGDTPYLTTLAWCLRTKCAPHDVPTWTLEKFWAEQATTDPAVPPKWDYGTAVANIDEPPTRELQAGDTLNFTALAPEFAWDLQFRTMETFEYEETMHARYGYDALQYHTQPCYVQSELFQNHPTYYLGRR